MWSRTEAARVYLQALEWLCQAKDGTLGPEVHAACVPFDDREQALHERYIAQQRGTPIKGSLSPTDTVLWSKVIAVVRQPQVLDSIHHGSAVELWALTQAFEFDCLIWSAATNNNIWVRSMEHVDDATAHTKLAETSNVLELVHQDMGVTGHYDLLDRSVGVRNKFPVTPWLQLWDEAGPEAVLHAVATMFEPDLPPLPPPPWPPRKPRKKVVGQPQHTAENPPTASPPTPSKPSVARNPTSAAPEQTDTEWYRHALFQ